MAFPRAFTRFDPFVGLGFGYGQDIKNTFHRGGVLSYVDKLNRGQFKVSSGVDIYLVERWSLGPRIDWKRGILGRKCARTRYSGFYHEFDEEACDDISNFDTEALPPFVIPLGKVRAGTSGAFRSASKVTFYDGARKLRRPHTDE